MAPHLQVTAARHVDRAPGGRRVVVIHRGVGEQEPGPRHRDCPPTARGFSRLVHHSFCSTLVSGKGIAQRGKIKRDARCINALARQTLGPSGGFMALFYGTVNEKHTYLGMQSEIANLPVARRVPAHNRVGNIHRVSACFATNECRCHPAAVGSCHHSVCTF